MSDQLDDRSRNLATNLIRCGTKFLLHDFTAEALKYIDTLIFRILKIVLWLFKRYDVRKSHFMVHYVSICVYTEYLSKFSSSNSLFYSHEIFNLHKGKNNLHTHTY